MTSGSRLCSARARLVWPVWRICRCEYELPGVMHGLLEGIRLSALRTQPAGVVAARRLCGRGAGRLEHAASAKAEPMTMRIDRIMTIAS